MLVTPHMANAALVFQSQSVGLSLWPRNPSSTKRKIGEDGTTVSGKNQHERGTSFDLSLELVWANNSAHVPGYVGRDDFLSRAPAPRR